MKSIKIIFIIIFFATAAQSSAQQYLAYNDTEYKETKRVTNSENKKENPTKNDYKWEFLSAVPSTIDNNIIKKTDKHSFGQRVTYLKVLMDKYYITKEDVIPGDPMMRTIVLNPVVYYTVRKIEKHLKSEMKNGDITTEEASSEMEHVLEVALSVIDTEEVRSFEMALNKNKKNVEDQISLFQQVKLQSIYK